MLELHMFLYDELICMLSRETKISVFTVQYAAVAACDAFTAGTSQ